MVFSRKVIKILVTTLSCVAVGSIISGSVAGVFINQKHSISLKKEGKVLFDGIIFDNKNEAFNYAKSLIKTSTIDATDKKIWSVSLKNASYLFDAPNELNSFLNKQIKTFQTTTDVYNHKLNLSDNSIINSQLVNYNIDNKTNTIIEPQYINVYEASNDTYTFNAQGDKIDDNEAINRAKDSYLSIHRVYYFNGIYFKSKQDLEIYLRNHYVNEAIGESEDTSNFRKIVSPINSSIRSNPIDFSPYINNNENYNNESLMREVNLKVAEFLMNNSYEYIRLGSTSNPSYIRILDNYLNYEDIQDVKVSDLPIISLKSNDNKSLYIVDASYEEEYNLFGPYFLETDSLIENITNKSLWTVTNDKPEQIIKSQVVEMFSGFLDLFMLDTSTSWTEKKLGLVYDNQTNTYVLPIENSLFNISHLEGLDLNELEKNMYLSLMQVKTSNNSNLYEQFINMANRLFKTKSFSSFYAIPVTYAYLIESIVDAAANYDVYLAVRDYYLQLCDLYDAILMNLFGKDILTKYEWLYTQNQMKQNEIFSFSDFFGINQSGFDYNSLGTILSGNNFLRDYKQLFAAAYVYVQAIANIQRNIKINYDVKSDNTILKVLAEGTNSDQNNEANIRNKFSLLVNETSIYDKLQAIYDSVGNISNIIDNEIKNEVFNDQEAFSIDLIKKSQTKLIEYENAEPSVNIINECNKLNNILNPIQTYSNSYNGAAKQITYKSLKYKATSKYKTSLKLSYDLEQSLRSNSFVGEFKDLNNQLSINNIFLINELKKELNFEIEVEQEFETSYEYFNEIKTIHEISAEEKIDNSSKKLQNFMSCVKGGMSILESVSKIIDDSANAFYPENIKAQLIASSVMDILSSTINIVSNFIPQPFGAIAKGISGVFSLISGVIGDAKQEIYEFKINEINGDTIKYYWDGGLVMNRLFGLIRDEVRGIDSLKMLSPIKITKQRNKDFYFFDGRTYDEGDISILKKDVIKEMLLHGDRNLKKVYSLNENLNNSYYEDKIVFENIYDSDINNESTLSQYVIDLVVRNINESINSIYVANLENEIFFNGYKFNSISEFQDTMQDKILNRIKPIYVAQLPQLDEKMFPKKEQLSFQLPYPYFESSNDEDNQIVYGPAENNYLIESKRQYVISNANEYINSQQLPETRIINNIKEVFRQSFNIQSKTVLKSSVLKNIYYSDFVVGAYDINIYYVEVFQDEGKYFITKEDAYNYLINSLNLKDNSFLLSSSKYEVLTIIVDNQRLYFNNYTEFIKWFEKNVKKVDDIGGV